MNAARPLLDLLLADPARPAVVEHPPGRSFSRGELRRGTLRVMGRLRGAGIRPGDRVLIQVPAGATFAAATLGAIGLGCVPVLIGPALGDAAFHARVEALRPRCTLYAPILGAIDAIPGLRSRLRRFGIAAPPLPSDPSRIARIRVRRRVFDSGTDPFAPPFAERDADDEAIVVATGGTTGSPKGVVMVHGALDAYLGQIANAIAGAPFQRLLADTPQQILYALRLGKTAHIVRGLPRRRARRAIELVRSGAVDSLFGSPSAVKEMLSLDSPEAGPLPPSLISVWLGGASVTRRFIGELVAATHPSTSITALYGATESGPLCAARAEEILSYDGEGLFVGRPIPPARLEIRGPEPGAHGEIVAFSPSLFAGYAGQARRAPSEGFETGDLGRALEVDGGTAFALCGRKKEMIIRRGVNIYPAMLEPALTDFRDSRGRCALDACALVGLWNESAEDESVVLCAVASGDISKDRRRFEAHVRAICGSEAAPDHVFFFDRFPECGRQSKLDREALRQACAARLPGGREHP